MQFDSDSTPIRNVQGKIKSVYCENFVTYAKCTFYPTEYLNVIIGPNGTGKSTLVAAIVLGLGGKPDLLSRSQSIGDYVKNGRDESVVRVEIYHDNYDKTVIFERHFSRSGKSAYKVNQETVNEKKYLATIAQYNIQISNLCQFLPQDRVQDFAKMDSTTIFMNTIKSVCSEDVLGTFENLKELRGRLRNGTDSVKKSKDKMEELQTQCLTLEQGMERYNEQQEFKGKLQVCEAKRLQLEAHALKESMNQQAKDLKLAQKKYEEQKKQHEVILQKQGETKRTLQQLESVEKQKGQQEEEITKTKNEIIEKIKALREQVQQENVTYEKKKREKSEYDKTLRNETSMLEILLQDFKKARDNLKLNPEWENEVRDCDRQIQNIKDEACEHARERAELNSKLDEFAPEILLLLRRIERANNIKEQKLQMMREHFPDIYKAVLWLSKNKDIFKGKVYNPMIMELNVHVAEHAKYFENTISNRDLLSFTCEDKEDMSTLVNELRINQNILINVGHAAPASEIRYNPPEPIDSLKRFGFEAYLIQLIEGPPAILNYLCKLSSLHRIPIGTAAVNNHTDEIPSHISLYFGGDQRYSASFSKYSGEKSLLQNQISGKNLLTSRNVGEVKQWEQRLTELTKNTDRLKNRRTDLEAKINELQIKRDEIGAQKRAIMEKRMASSQLEEKLKRQKEKVMRIKQNAINLRDLEHNLTNNVNKFLKSIMRLQNDKIEYLEKMENTTVERKMATVKGRIFKQENEELFNEEKEANDAKNQALRMVETIKRALDNTNHDYNVKLHKAKDAASNCGPRELFNQFPDTLEELKECINEFKARLECMGDVDQRIVSEYKQKCDDIEKLKNAIQNTEHDYRDVAQQIDALHGDWFMEIERIIFALNRHFGEFMQSMGYVGQVNLSRREESDYDTYGIEILVQYRSNAMLQALDRHVQSGGERAVAIATYTLSLQHLTHVPFRCVDEINQGMDANNERKIFEMIVKETTQEGRAQYFFVTPKLLTNLIYNDRMSVHIVFNGKTVASPDVFSCAL